MGVWWPSWVRRVTCPPCKTENQSGPSHRKKHRENGPEILKTPQKWWAQTDLNADQAIMS